MPEEKRISESSVEEIELMYRKSARGEIPHEGDVLLRANRGWVFSPPILDIAALRFDGDLATAKSIGTNGFVKFSGVNAVPTDEADIYEDTVSLGAGNIIEERIEDGELLIRAGGLFLVSGVVTYDNLNQESKITINLRRDGFEFRIAQTTAEVDGAAPFVVDNVELTIFLQQGDFIFLEFGRANAAPFTADVVNATLLAYVIALDRTA